MSEQLQEGRSWNYDFLRVICTIAVILIHVSSSYKNAYMDASAFGRLYTDNLLATCVYNVIPRFAVPCFVMLSGAFILADDRNANYYAFWNKKIRKTGIPTLIFSCGYTLWNMLTVLHGGGEKAEIIRLFKQFVTGNSYFHMWYMYMLAGIYFLTPFLVLIRIHTIQKDLKKIVCVFMIWAGLSAWTSQHLLTWDLGRAFLYTGYFMTGYLIREQIKERKNNRLGICLILCGIIIELVTAYVQYIHIMRGIAEQDEVYGLISPETPWILSASVLIFYGFSFLNVKKKLDRISSYTFYIYLFHGGVWNIIVRRIMKYCQINSSLAIPVCVAVVFLISYIFSRCYKICADKVQRRISLWRLY